MKATVATGISPTTASRVTVSDIKAADSDQTIIPPDTEGQYKTQVPKDWYNHLQGAFRIKKDGREVFWQKGK